MYIKKIYLLYILEYIGTFLLKTGGVENRERRRERERHRERDTQRDTQRDTDTAKERQKQRGVTFENECLDGNAGRFSEDEIYTMLVTRQSPGRGLVRTCHQFRRRAPPEPSPLDPICRCVSSDAVASEGADEP